MIVFESFVKVLHFLHWVAAMTCIAACVHLIVRLTKSRVDKRIYLHARTLLVAYLAVYTLGSLVYPTFRVRVRAEFLDRVYPWATGLFEIKEHAATLALLPVVGIFLLSRPLISRSERQAPLHAPLLLGLSVLVMGVLMFNACVGWYLGTLRSV